MFQHEGPARNARINGLLAGYLAFVAGFVNSGGFVFIGSFTSHVTGSVGRLSIDAAHGRPGAAALAILMVLTFFGGAFGASLILEGVAFGTRARAYGTALLVESVLLGAFVFIAGLSHATHPRILDAEAALLCMAMGMQNSLVTRLSGAVIRTTHLTGVVTDLAIETARWLRWHRAQLAELTHLGFGPAEPPERPAPAKAMLLLTIVAWFTAGGMLGGLLTLQASRWAIAVPAVAILAASGYAFSNRSAPKRAA